MTKRAIAVIVGCVVALFWALEVKVAPVSPPFGYNEIAAALAAFAGPWDALGCSGASRETMAHPRRNRRPPGSRGFYEGQL